MRYTFVPPPHTRLQVVISTEQLAVPDHSEEPEADENMWLDGQLVRYMLQSFLPQIPTEEEKRHLISDLLTAVQEDEDKKVQYKTQMFMACGNNKML